MCVNQDKLEYATVTYSPHPSPNPNALERTEPYFLLVRVLLHQVWLCSLLSSLQDYRLLSCLGTASVWNIADIHGGEKGENIAKYTLFLKASA